VQKIFILILTILIIGCSSSPEKLLEKGNKFAEELKFEKALKTYESLMKTFPNDTLAQTGNYSIAWIEINKNLSYESGYAILKDISENHAELEIGKAAKNDIKNFTRWLINKTNELRTDSTAYEALNTVDYIADNFKEDPLLAEALYLKGNIYLNDLKEYYRAINTYNEVIYKFRGTNFEPMSKFMIGYIYANVQNDYRKAEITYSEFLQEFPDHELVPSVKFELEYLGKKIRDIEELKLNDNQ
jgi:outer membrane protein assembly factor BamD (BamD/ComL family)